MAKSFKGYDHHPINAKVEFLMTFANNSWVFTQGDAKSKISFFTTTYRSMPRTGGVLDDTFRKSVVYPKVPLLGILSL